MDIDARFKVVSDARARAALKEFLEKFLLPAFGALPKREIELAVFELLRELGVVSKNASLFDLMTELRVTRSKASQLLFDLEVRASGDDRSALDAAIVEALTRTRFAKDGDYFVIELENPLILAHLRNRIRELGHISDTSFNSALVRMPLVAARDLVQGLIPSARHEQIRRALVAAGAPDTSISGVLLASLKQLGARAVGTAANSLVDSAAEYLGPLITGAVDDITRKWSSLWAGQEDGAL